MFLFSSDSECSSGANKDANDAKSRTTLFLATQYGHEAMVKFLHESGENTTMP